MEPPSVKASNKPVSAADAGEHAARALRRVRLRQRPRQRQTRHSAGERSN